MAGKPRPRCPRCKELYGLDVSMRKETYWYCPSCGVVLNPYVYYVITKTGVKRLMGTKPRKKNPEGLFEAFHGVPSIRKRKVYYEPPPKELIAIGELSQLNYKPVRGQHKNTEYYHMSGDTGSIKLSTNLILATDKKGRNLYLVKKNKNIKRPYFSKFGIIG